MGEQLMPHTLTLDERKNLTMTGVTEVVSFDENTVMLHTSLGSLIVQGQQLQLKIYRQGQTLDITIDVGEKIQTALEQEQTQQQSQQNYPNTFPWGRP